MDKNNIILNEDEVDCLQELMNVAYGSATAAIADIINAFAQLSIPNIKIIDTNKLKDYLSFQINSQENHYVSLQQINGKISGESMFVIDSTSAENISIKFGLERDELNDDEVSDIVLEITNILSASILGKLVEFMDTNVSFSPPIIKKIDNINKIDDTLIGDYQKVIVISTMLHFEDLNIIAELAILTTDKSISFIKEKLNQILEDF